MSTLTKTASRSLRRPHALIKVEIPWVSRSSLSLGIYRHRDQNAGYDGQSQNQNLFEATGNPSVGNGAVV